MSDNKYTSEDYIRLSEIVAHRDVVKAEEVAAAKRRSRERLGFPPESASNVSTLTLFGDPHPLLNKVVRSSCGVIGEVVRYNALGDSLLISVRGPISTFEFRVSPSECEVL